MNTTEHLVEIYYRQLGCFTVSDIKIEKGNNRQFDILAYNYKKQKFYHIEVNVAMEMNMAKTLDSIKECMRYKFFGTTRNSRPDNLKTDFAKGKTYLDAIKATYEKFGINYDEIVRVWCTWCLPDTETLLDDWKQELAIEFTLQPDNFEILLFRDEVLQELLQNIGTAHYDDELLRTLSLIKGYKQQTENRQKLNF